jgi:hypothetical protein
MEKILKEAKAYLAKIYEYDKEKHGLCEDLLELLCRIMHQNCMNIYRILI